MRHGHLTLTAVAAMFSPVCLAPALAEPVDVELVLAVDVSLSMSPGELQIQREGYAAAINHPAVVSAILDGGHGRIAVTMFEWAGEASQREILPWTVIASQADADAVSAAVLATPSIGMRRTSISGALSHATNLIETNAFDGVRRVIDVSGDGPNNQGSPVTEQRDKAAALGIVINGLPLMTNGGLTSSFSIENLDEYYTNCVIGGPGGVMIPVNDWDQFPEAIRRKLVLEIGGYHPPARILPAQFSSEPYDCLIGEKLWQQRRWQWDLDDR